MSKNHAPIDDSPEEGPGFLAKQINSAEVGVDQDGFHHHYWRGADTLVVYDDSGVDHVEYLEGRLLADWVEFVDGERGWEQKGAFASALIKADTWRKE